MNTSENFLSGILFIMIVGISVWFWIDHHSLQNKLDVVAQGESLYRTKMLEMGDKLDTANSRITEAKGYAWKTNIEMGNALDHLQTSN